MVDVELSTQEVAQRLTQALGKIYTARDVAILARLGSFTEAVKIGNQWRIQEKDVDRYIAHVRRRRQALLRLGAVSAILLFIFSVISATADTGAILDRLFPTSTPDPAKPAISQMTISESTDSYNIELTVSNLGDEEILVKRIELMYDHTVDYSKTNVIVLCSISPVYEISDVIEITEVEGQTLDFKTVVQKSSAEMSEYQFNAYGRYAPGICNGDIEIYFAASLVLESNKYTTFNIVIPKRIHIISPSFEDGGGKHDIEDLFILSSYGGENNYLSFKLSTDNSGDLLYRAKLIDGEK